MSQAKKHKVNLWKRESQKGTIYLMGKDKDNGLRYYVFLDKDDADARRLVSKPLSDPAAEFETVATLKKKLKNETEEVYYADGPYFLGVNNYYFEDDADAEKGGKRFLTRKDGSQVLGTDGEPLEKNSHVLLIDVQ